MSLPVGSCPVSRQYCSSRYKRSPRSTNVCLWRTKSCSGSSKIATCFRVPVASPPPPPSTHLGTRLPFQPRRLCPPDNLYLASSSIYGALTKTGAVPKTWITAALSGFAHQYYKSFGLDALEHSHALYLFFPYFEAKQNNEHTSGFVHRLFFHYNFSLLIVLSILLVLGFFPPS